VKIRFMKDEEIDDLIISIIAHQNDTRFHPLTCGNDSRHTPLVPTRIEDGVILICIDCDYEQSYIPITT
jgi:hypothetical protein